VCRGKADSGRLVRASRCRISCGRAVPDAPDPHATLPAEERGTGSLDNPNDTARWLALADTALSRGASDDAVAETERLARKEQAAIKRRIRRTAEKVKSHSKSKQ